MTADLKVAVLGLGYVGLPLAIALSKRFPCIGVDIDAGRIRELKEGVDRTLEIEPAVLRSTTLKLTADIESARGADVFIITVPTPVDVGNQPDLRAVMSATKSVGRVISHGAIVVYESTVYPGVTEEICGPLLAEVSGLKRGDEFFLGYSPERINPGDRQHTVDRITKVIAGENAEVIEVLAQVYGAVTTGGVFRAASIKAAEAAKVIENAQRDINIAFMNEITQIFGKMGLSIYDVLDAAATKWNFLRFTPGLVGGHCIGVDPYYLAHKAQQLGHSPRVVLAGRETNDSMGSYIADQVHGRLAGRTPADILVLGLTFKEDVPDLRNSKVADVIRRLEWLGHRVTVHDPLADAAEAEYEYALKLDPDALTRNYDAVVAAVPHAIYRELDATAISRLLRSRGVLADVKGIWREQPASQQEGYWSL